MSDSAATILALAPVLPVVTINDLSSVIPLGKALLDGGLPVLEVTLRTPEGLQAIRMLKDALPDAVVGAGTVLSVKDLDEALAAGADFIVTPGATRELLNAGAQCGKPFIPGFSTVSEMMACLDAGLFALKFFPAEVNGGPAALRAFSGPFPHVSFCPTGGVTPANLASYLALPAVKSVGGSWMCAADDIAMCRWERITDLARQACEQVAEVSAERSGAACPNT